MSLSSCASSTSERNLTRNGVSTPDETSVIRAAFGKEQKFEEDSFSKLFTWILAITDLSLPEEQQNPVELYSIWNNTAGDHPRVTPGPYLVRVGCEIINGFSKSKKMYNVKIDAKPGKLYLVECEQTGYSTSRVDVREVEQLETVLVERHTR
ncbi:MAG: hypothetical protein OQK51_13780 [Kangiellaceae bacterium]|nr:hypothetical protein [Kangiellaceae bacterium]